ncbi:hypothetical protein SPBR_00874 [Sporothrix brasiliensis 5110]|uniref:Calpain n=1 Tax=Sporothrix brasiliensis 5110 TaxID=1398154 RepID=A0A0C2J0K0_9PEZI|nr:uncharacterized protein SPBR_00874 [Sporothrix brasiliensis 5110]KIH90657.1 hypothetical protein SPBR_00874 [Sporothrix brasiliensis 5110]
MVVPPPSPSSQLPLPATLDRVQILSLPATAFYIAEFITEEEERQILQRVEAAPKPKWKQLSHRRLQTWPSDLLHDKLLDAPLPPWLVDPVITRLLTIPVGANRNGDDGENDDRDNIFANSPHKRPNHVLINEYPPGVGIMPHKNNEDGTLHTEPVARILQEPRSLLITTDNLYTDYLHGIADIDKDIDLSEATIANWDLLQSKELFASGQSTRETRVSLTYRDVLKVSKLGNKFGMFKRP